MKEHVITIDVYAHWGEKPPRYRIYVDKDLLTERDFIWPGPNVYIKENVIVNLEAGTHIITVEHVNNSGTIHTENVTLNGKPSSYQFITE